MLVGSDGAHAWRVVGLGQVILDDAISSVELVNCQRMKVQIRGSVPSVAVDKTDGFMCYLSKDGLSTSFITSKVCGCLGIDRPHTMGVCWAQRKRPVRKDSHSLTTQNNTKDSRSEEYPSTCVTPFHHFEKTRTKITTISFFHRMVYFVIRCTVLYCTVFCCTTCHSSH